MSTPIDYVGTPPGATLVPGTTSLYTISGAPEGLLFKKISNVQQAINLGGLILVSKAKQNRCLLRFGQTLVDAVSAGNHTTYTAIHPMSNPAGYDAVHVPAFDSDEIYTYPSGDATVKRRKGFYVTANIKREELDEAGAWAMGIVTNADAGGGLTAAPPLGLTRVDGNFVDSSADGGVVFATSKLVMPRTMEEILASMKEIWLGTIDQKGRGLYAAKYDSVLAALPDKTSRPTLEFTFTWHNSSLVGNLKITPQLAYCSNATLDSLGLAEAGAVKTVQQAENWDGVAVITGININRMLMPIGPGQTAGNSQPGDLPFCSYHTQFTTVTHKPLEFPVMDGLEMAAFAGGVMTGSVVGGPFSANVEALPKPVLALATYVSDGLRELLQVVTPELPANIATLEPEDGYAALQSMNRNLIAQNRRPDFKGTLVDQACLFSLMLDHAVLEDVTP